MPNGFSHSYQLDEPISDFSVCFFGIFLFYSNRKFFKQIVKTLIGWHRISDLGLHCLHRSHKKEARLIWVNRKEV